MTSTRQVSSQKVAASTLSGGEKAALLLLALGEEKATRLLRRLGQSELQEIARTAQTLRPIAWQQFEQTVSEFAKIFSSWPEFADSGQALEKLLADMGGGGAPAAIRDEHAPEIWRAIAKLELDEICALLASEQAQTAVIVLTRLEASVAAMVLSRMDEAARREIIQRLITSRPPSPPALAAVERALAEHLFSREQRSDLSAVARLLNRLDRRTNAALLEDLARSLPDDVRRLREMVFDFDDIAQMPIASRTMLLDQVPAERLVVALRTAAPELQSLLLASLSARARRMAEVELRSGQDVHADDVQAARREIVDVALALAAKGELALRSAPDRGG